MSAIYFCSLRFEKQVSCIKLDLFSQHLYLGTSISKKMDIKKVCQVCFSRANQNRFHSQHYGAICCNNCRSFFRRTIQLHGTENMSSIYSCDSNTEGQDCDMKEYGKNHRCAKCRLSKCTEVGMNPNKVITDPAFRQKFRGKNTSLLKLHNVIILCSFFSESYASILMKLCMKLGQWA